MSNKKQKEKAIGYVLEAMKEIVANLKASAETEDVATNSDAMVRLAEAYEKIESSDISAQSEQITELVKLAGGYADGGFRL